MISLLLLACFNMPFPLRYPPLPFGEENRFAVSCLTLLGVAQSTSRFHAALERYIVIMLFSKMFFWFRSVKTQNLTPNCSHPIFFFDFFRLPVWLVSIHLKPSETTTKSQSSTAAQDGCGAMSPAIFLIWPVADSNYVRVPKLATCKIPMAHWHFVIWWRWCGWFQSFAWSSRRHQKHANFWLTDVDWKSSSYENDRLVHSN